MLRLHLKSQAECTRCIPRYSRYTVLPARRLRSAPGYESLAFRVFPSFEPSLATVGDLLAELSWRVALRGLGEDRVRICNPAAPRDGKALSDFSAEPARRHALREERPCLARRESESDRRKELSAIG